MEDSFVRLCRCNVDIYCWGAHVRCMAQRSPTINNIAKPLVSTNDRGLADAARKIAALEKLRDACKPIHTLTKRLSTAEKVSIVAVGDVSFARDVEAHGNRQGGNMHYVFDHVRKIFHDADVALLNLESVLSPSATAKARQTRGIVLGGHVNGTLALQGLSSTTIVTMAHNHLLDLGPEAVRETSKALRAKSVTAIGIDDDTKAENSITLFERKNVTFAFLAYCNLGACRQQRNGQNIGAKMFQRDDAMKTLKALRRGVDVIVVSMHWGNEYYHTIDDQRLNQAVFLSEQGVDVIIGHHPHVLQDHMMIGRTTFVAFSLGNFVFDSHVCRDVDGRITNESKLKSAGCRRVHPSRQDAVAESTRATRLYRISVSKRGFESAEYLNGRIGEEHADGQPIYRPQPVGDWIEACGKADLHCHMCA
eukprot:m.119698 g.119698  ORF g.119698 m.119698 type:complete len:421 (+) comp28755_c0_seq1:217-1479(+)